MRVAIDPELNLFGSDPALLGRGDGGEYERAAAALAALADPRRLLLLHALAVGQDTPQRAALWAGLTQTATERELVQMTLAGLVERRDSPRGPLYAPRDGHLVVELHVALAHGREERSHPRLLGRRRGRAMG